MSQENQKDMEQYFFRASAADFKKIPGSPIAYWTSSKFLSLFKSNETLRGYGVNPATGMQTGDNNRFIRCWFEVSDNKRGVKWISLNDGGDVRKWYGNFISCIDWGGGGESIRAHKSSVIRNAQYYFREGATWNRISSAFFAIRYLPEGFIFDQAGDALFADENQDLFLMIGFLNSPIGFSVMKILCPTLNATAGNLELFPYPERAKPAVDDIKPIIKKLISHAQVDWDSYETSWDFTSLLLLNPNHYKPMLKATYQRLRADWREMALDMQRLEEENNRIFIEAYGLQDELSPDVPLKEITLTCNPHYRYGGDRTDAELEAQLQADTMAEFLSYSVGCMFGRYSLDKPGLVLANQGETLAEYLRQIPEPRFMPDEDNVIPLLDGEWFPDDVTERFRAFLRVTFGDEHYEENLAFIEQSLGKDVRKYFIKDFYADHVKRYKKRPIYWLFASPKGTFSVLIYLHRYRPDTVSVVLRYLRDFRKKLAARLDYLQQVGISASASQGEKTKANKEVETIKKQLLELDDYERETLYPLATEQVALDLDDGVKVNYLKLGPALKKIVGLDAKAED
ncbi:BREX-1 system adenine-specific DNA-methyltransferase PglX [Pseudomonas fluorescens]|uniref:BREX-1 system adenine-specific DNA-methyltransferase PglX n=1 Tax=Pseudomonas fluorescens TaxID=294 RepID=UPI0009BB1C87|nr:BREX-1 system adenine-specific DNA-methyltransferase PglX [Pseudomonas fluorescens]